MGPRSSWRCAAAFLRSGSPTRARCSFRRSWTRCWRPACRWCTSHRPADLELLEQAAARAGRRVRVSLRLRREGIAISPLDRLNRRLGLSAGEILDACRRFARSPWIEISAVNFYLGTQQSSLAGFTRVFRGVLALLERVAAETGVVIREVNLGGGIPSLSLRKVGPRQLLARWRDRPGAAGGPERQEEFAAGLGRRFRELADGARLPERPDARRRAGALDRRRRGGAGLPRPRGYGKVGVPGRQPQLPPRVAAAVLPAHPAAGPAAEERADRFYHLSGSTLNTLDVLDLRRRLPRLEPGDALAFCDAGAYSISRASPYAGLPPAVYMLQEDGEVRQVREAGGIDHLLHPMILQEETAGVER